MMKANLIKEIARVVEMPQREAKIVLEVILDGMVRALRKGERVELRGFGTFDTHVRARRIARNPRTGVRVNVPARRVPHFKPGKELIALVNISADATERRD
jgi:integration host factor subunit beta